MKFDGRKPQLERATEIMDGVRYPIMRNFALHCMQQHMFPKIPVPEGVKNQERSSPSPASASHETEAKKDKRVKMMMSMKMPSDNEDDEEEERDDEEADGDEDDVDVCGRLLPQN